MPILFLVLLGGVAFVVISQSRGNSTGSLATLQAARDALRAGVVETGPNTGPVVDEYLRAVGIAPPANWCAAAVSAWIRAGYKSLGRNPPVDGGAQAKGFITKFEKLGRWIPKDKIRNEVPPGSVIIWWRGDPASWTGHIGIVEQFDGTTFQTIEGNSGPKGDRVARMVRKLNDEHLLGIGVLP